MMFLFFNATTTPDIYTLSLHDALPIFVREVLERTLAAVKPGVAGRDVYVLASERFHEEGYPTGLYKRDGEVLEDGDRKSTRLNSSHTVISYAVFCLKKKKK